MTTLFLDTETYSECDLRAHGTHRYAEHESTRITVAQWAIDDDEPVVLDMTDSGDGYPAVAWLNQLTGLLKDPAVEIVAHNSAFDRTLIRHCWGIDVPIERWRDTMVRAMAHGLPGALGKIGPILGLPDDELKDTRGKQLIQIFCKPRPKNSKVRRATRETHPTEWAEFLEYSRQDVVSMRAIHRLLPQWNYRDDELALWHLDQRINDRGFQVDVDLARAAIAATDIEKARLKAEMREATDDLVDGPSKRDDLLAFILAEHGVDLPDMKADTLRRRLEDPELPDAVKLLISIRLESTKTSTAKYQALVKAVSPDGRLRNTLQFAGAIRTSRWAGRIFQPQNMPRPTDGFDGELQELAIEALKAGYATVDGDVMLLTSNCIRGTIVAAPGKKLVAADLSNIEGRKLAWLADERWKMKAFADFDAGRGHDLYRVAYGRAFNMDPADVGKGMRRQIGKVMELGLGYEGGVAAFVTFAAVYKMDLGELADAVHSTAPKDQLARAYGVYEWATKKGMKATGSMPKNVYVACEVLKHAWRQAHPATTELWAAAKEGVIDAIQNPGLTFNMGPRIRCQRDEAWLRVRLPSGRYLCYLKPEVDDYGQISYMGVNQYTRQWCRIKTYGGKLIENADQASSRDVLAASMPKAEDAGFPIVLTVHDELITEPYDVPCYAAAELARIMCDAPAWAEGLPLAAAGFEAYRYRKD